MTMGAKESSDITKRKAAGGEFTNIRKTAEANDRESSDVIGLDLHR